MELFTGWTTFLLLDQQCRSTTGIKHEPSAHLYMAIQVSYLDKQRNAVETADDDSVVDITCKDVQRSDGSFDQLFHTYAIDVRALCQAIRTQLTHTNTRTPVYWPVPHSTDRRIKIKCTVHLKHNTLCPQKRGQ